jgi:ATP synthase protein I
VVDKRPRRSTESDYARFLGIGFVFLLIVSIFAVGGLLVDNLLGTLPLLLLLGLGVGFAAGLYYLYLALEKLGSG